MKLQLLLIEHFVPDTLFPRVDKWLHFSTNHSVREHLTRIMEQQGYHCLIDCLFSETFPSHKKYCFNFYKGKGKSLSEQVTSTERHSYELFLLQTLRDMKSLIYLNKRFN